MKLIAEKTDDKYRCVIPVLGVLTFDGLPQWDYLWSGYASMSGGEDQFVKYNFGNCRINDKSYYMCSTENGIALLEYIDRYLLEREQFAELEECLIAEMDYWFCLAWECAMGDYNELPDWCHAIVDLYMQQGHILRYDIETDKYEDDVFIFDRVGLSGNCKKSIESILNDALAECLREDLVRLEENELWDALKEQREYLEEVLKRRS